MRVRKKTPHIGAALISPASLPLVIGLCASEILNKFYAHYYIVQLERRWLT